MDIEYKNQVINYFKKSKNKRVNYNLIGKHIGSGFEGDVFLYDKNKIIKIIECFDNKSYCQEIFRKLKKIQKLNSEHVAKIYDFGSLSYDDDKLKYSLQKKNYIIYYITERLYKIKSLNKKWEDDNFLNSFGSLYYDDLWLQNIMKTKTGKQKICDLTGFDKK